MAEKRSYKDRAESNKRAVAKRRRKIRLLAIEQKGGACSQCGYKKCIEALEFHHLDKARKEFGLSQGGLTRSWERVQKEIAKCILVCANCHREVHAGITQPLRETLE